MKIHKYQVEITAEFYLTATSEQEAADKAMKLVTRNHDLLSISSLRKTPFTVWNPPELPSIDDMVAKASTAASTNGARLDFSDAELVTPEINDEVPF